MGRGLEASTRPWRAALGALGLTSLGTLMNRFRRRVGALAVATLSLQAAGLGLGAAVACVDTVHRHGSAEAPDCPAHHHQPVSTQAAEGHHHHDSASSSPARDDAPRMSCRCSADVPSLSAGQAAVLPQPPSVRPSLREAHVTVQAPPDAGALRLAPLAPPPRLRFS